IVPSVCSIRRHRVPRMPRSAARPSPTGPPPMMRTGVSSDADIDRLDQPHDARPDIAHPMHLVHYIAEGETAIGIAEPHRPAHAGLAKRIPTWPNWELRRVEQEAERLAIVTADHRFLRPILLGTRGIERGVAQHPLALDAAAIGEDRIEPRNRACVAMAVRRRNLGAAEFRRVVIERHRPLPAGAREHRIRVLRRLLGPGDEFGTAQEIARIDAELKIDAKRQRDLVAVELAEALAGHAANDLADEKAESADVIGGLRARRRDRRLRGERL